MTTYNTGNPLGSAAAKDLYDNAENFDHLSNDKTSESWNDRLGMPRLTWHGMEERYKQTIASLGWILVNSFQLGATLTLTNQALKDESSGEYYRWDGMLPKSVPTGSAPLTTGGIGPGAWISVGDGSLRNNLASSTGTSLIGMPDGGTLADTIHTVSVDQWSHLVGVDNDWSLAIQAAIDYMSAAGGGIVELGVGEYRALLIQKPRVMLKGQGMLLTKIKAPDDWNARAVIESWNYDYAVSVGSGSPDPGCYCAGFMDLTVDGNLQNWAGTASDNSGYGILHLGACMVFSGVKVQYAPGIGMRTMDWGTNRAKFAVVMPGWGYPLIGELRNIRIQFCGNECWVNEAQDYYIDDVEIVGAGEGFSQEDDTRSYLYPNERVANFRNLRAIDIGFMHVYGNYNGYGFVSGTDTSTFFVRTKVTQLICESCMISAWFKPATYSQVSKLDIHECSGDINVPIHGSFNKVPIAIFSGTNRGSTFSNIEVVQSTTHYDGICLHIDGQYNLFENIRITRSDTTTAPKAGTGIWITGTNNIINAAVKGVLGTVDSEGNPSTGVVLAGGAGNIVNAKVGASTNGYRLTSSGSISSGTLEISSGGSVANTFTGFSILTSQERKRIALLGGGQQGNRSSFYSSAALDLSSTDIKTLTIGSLNLPYVPESSELSYHIDITAFAGSSIYPSVELLNYNKDASTTTSLVFNYKSRATSPMSVRLAVSIG
jgi:hypothetical protein